jgi:hypothetical protein
VKAFSFYASKSCEDRLMLVEQLHFWEDYHGALALLKQIVKVNNREAKGFHLLALTYFVVLLLECF